MVDISRKKTQKGNPKDYVFLLECGHIKIDFHSARISMDAFSVIKNVGNIYRYCKGCLRNKKIDYKTIKTFFGRKGVELIKEYNEFEVDWIGYAGANIFNYVEVVIDDKENNRPYLLKVKITRSKVSIYLSIYVASSKTRGFSEYLQQDRIFSAFDEKEDTDWWF